MYVTQEKGKNLYGKILLYSQFTNRVGRFSEYTEYRRLCYISHAMRRGIRAQAWTRTIDVLDRCKNTNPYICVMSVYGHFIVLIRLCSRAYVDGLLGTWR